MEEKNTNSQYMYIDFKVHSKDGLEKASITLNLLEKDGWERYHMYHNNELDLFYYFFKKPIQ